MSDQLYREIILEHWKYPQNYGVIQDSDIDVSEVNPLCGDEIRITAKIENTILTDIAFTAQGCAISKASASLFTEQIKGQKIESIKQMTEEDVLKLVEVKLTPARIKCALLVYNTLNQALTD